MRKIRLISGVFFLSMSLLLALSAASCKKIKGLSNGNLEFSQDTVVFDTVFTTVGSTTQRLKIYNNANQALNVQEVELMGGSNSPFRLNVDGSKGTNFANLEIEKKDSLFIFIEVTLQVNNANLPMIIEDQIRFRTNGKDQFVQLAVWGQDAYFHNKDINSGTWPNDKPHVVYGYAGIDSATTLNILAGTKIYMHKDALLFNFKGTLNIQGTKTDKVVIQGDRLESYYQDKAGQFYGIYMQEARPSTIEHVEIKNGTAGIHVFSKAPGFSAPTLTLTYSEIYNNSRYGVFIYAGAKVKAENCLIYKNQSHALLVLQGGDFNFNHCHLLGYASSGQVPAVGINNYFKPQGSTTTIVGDINEGTITNSVITGNQQDEFVIDTFNPNGTAILTFNIQNCLIKVGTIPTSPYFSDTMWNSDPLFINISENNFQFASNSPLNNNGNGAFPAFFDFGENPRSVNNPDIGAWELP